MDDIWKHHEEMFKNMAQIFGTVFDDSMPEIIFGKMDSDDHGFQRLEGSGSPRDEMLLKEPDSNMSHADKKIESFNSSRPSLFGGFFPKFDDLFSEHSKMIDRSFKDDLMNSKNDPFQFFHGNSDGNHSPSIRMSGSQKSVRIVVRPDGSREEYHTERDSAGNVKETVMTRRDGQEKVTVKTRTPNGQEQIQESTGFSDLFRGDKDRDLPGSFPRAIEHQKKDLSSSPINIHTPARNNEKTSSWTQPLHDWWNYFKSK